MAYIEMQHCYKRYTSGETEILANQDVSFEIEKGELVKYNENPGHLHRRDENGNRIQLRFATMLAKKK